MNDWIALEEGEYEVTQALLVATDYSAAAFKNVRVSVFCDRKGQRQLKGQGRVRNVLIVALLEDNDIIDLVLDFGPAGKFILRDPDLKGAMVFSPDAESILRFEPRTPWERLSEREFAELVSKLVFVQQG